MKTLFTLVVSLLFTSFGFSQTTTGTLKYNGATYPADITEYNLPPAEATKVIQDQMSTMGFNPQKGKDYLVYRDVQSDKINNGTPTDLIFKIDRKSKKQSDVSVVSLITAKSGEIPESKVKGVKGLSPVTSAVGTGVFLQGFNSKMANQAHNLAVDSKAKDVSSAQKELDKLKKDQTSLEKKIKDLQSDLEKNAQKQQAQLNTINSLQHELEVLKSTAPNM